MLEELDASLARLFAEAGVENVVIDHREFPDEHWAVVHVPASFLVASQAVVPQAESLVRAVFGPSIP